LHLANWHVDLLRWVQHAISPTLESHFSVFSLDPSTLDYSQIYYLPLTINIEDYYKHRSRFPVIVLL
jgi:hypothetical protein